MKRLVFLRQLSLFALISLLFASCTKELTPIGLDLLDPLDLLHMGYTDTIQINAYTIPDDSVYTHNLSVDDANAIYYGQVGSFYDPIFGRTTANFYSQLYLSTSTRFGSYPVFDSAFLYLPYLSAYGDTLTNMTLRVYSLTDSIVDSIHCWSNSTINYDQAHPIGELTFQPRPNDSAYYNGSKQPMMLRIPINSNFGNAVMFPQDTSSLNNNTNFVRFYKGLCIIAEPENTPGKGSIIMFRISDASKLSMYYHTAALDTLSYDFLLSSSASKFQNYNHYGYSQAIPALRNQLAGDTTLGKQFLFVQGLAGVKIKLQFPNLAKWGEKNGVVINDAQLILGNSSVSKDFVNPGNITLREIGEAGTTSPNKIIDESTRADYYSGYYYPAGNTYRFRITRYIQQYLLGKTNQKGLHLIIPHSYMGNRLVLNGTSSPISDLKLYLRYTVK